MPLPSKSSRACDHSWTTMSRISPVLRHSLEERKNLSTDPDHCPLHEFWALTCTSSGRSRKAIDEPSHFTATLRAAVAWKYAVREARVEVPLPRFSNPPAWLTPKSMTPLSLERASACSGS